MWCGWTFGGRVRIIFASWVNFNRAIISKRQLSVDDGLQIQKNQHIKHDFLSELFSNEDTKKVGRHLRHSWHVFHLYFLGGFETRIRKSKYSVRHRHARPEFWYLFCLLFSLHYFSPPKYQNLMYSVSEFISNTFRQQDTYNNCLSVCSIAVSHANCVL